MAHRSRRGTCEEAPVMVDSVPKPDVGSFTIGDVLARVAPGKTWAMLSHWPPDVFAVTSIILADSGAYRLVICPPEGECWPCPIPCTRLSIPPS